MARKYVGWGTLLLLASWSEAEAKKASFRHVTIDPHTPRLPHCKAVGDIDGDKLPDVVIGTAEGLFLYQYPNWNRRRIDTGGFTTDMQVGDVDRDGDLDIIISRKKQLLWYENPMPAGNPIRDSWKSHQVDAMGAHDLEIGDIDGDGKLDIAVRDKDTRLYFQQSPAKWAKVEIVTGGRAGTGLGDIDGDGDLDIAQNGYWLEAPDDKIKGVWQRHEFASGWPSDSAVHVADVNKDGRQDIVIAPAEAKGRLVWYETKTPKENPWTEHVIDAEVAFLHTFKTADIDGDGALDLVTAEMEQTPLGRINVYYNRGKALKWAREVIGHHGSHNLRLADIGNDGDIDVVGANHGNLGGPTPVELWENLRSKPNPKLPPKLSLDRWKRHVIDADRPGRAIFVMSADLNGDAHRDIVAGAHWYENPGKPDGAWTRGDIAGPTFDAAVVYDFDDDGFTDVLGTTRVGKEKPAIVWARNKGKDGAFAPVTVIPSADGDFLQGAAVVRSRLKDLTVALSFHRPGKGVQLLKIPAKAATKEPWTLERVSELSQNEALSVADIDRDDDLDVLLGTKWLRKTMDGWRLETISDKAGAPDRNRLADINGDGRLDSVVGFEAISKPGKVTWFEHPANLEKGTWSEHVIGTVVGPMSLDVGDLDRDGDLDVVVGEHNLEAPEKAKLHLFENIDGNRRIWKGRVVHTGDEHHDGAQLVDIDCDGDMDILSIGWKHTRVLLYENQAIDTRLK